MEWVHKNYRVFHIKRKSEGEMPRWHAFNLIPDERRVGEAAAAEYANKMICWMVSQGRSEEYTRLYHDVPASEVYEMFALKRAEEY